MTEKTPNQLPTQELAQSYLKRVNEDLVIELRVKEIANKIDAVFKKVYQVDETMVFDYVCYFIDKTMVFKLNGANGKIIFPSLPESCLWDNTDLHINMNLLESDVVDARNKARKLKESEVVEPPTLWEKIRSWF